MKLLVNNLVTETTITVNDENGAFPKEFMINETLIEKTRFTDYIDIDLGEAKTIDSLVLVSTLDDTLIVQANSTESWITPPYQLVISQDVNFINETYRYWRVAIVTLSLSAITYSSGTDAELTSPNDIYDTQANFVPVDIATTPVLKIGTYRWDSSTGIAGQSVVYDAGSLGSTYGNVIIHSDSNDWVGYAPTLDNGFKYFNLPKSANGDGLGGRIGYYYHRDAWLNVGNVDFELAQNGTVYTVGNVGNNSELIVRWDGVKGFAGGGDLIEDTSRPITGSGTSQVNYFYLGQNLSIECVVPGSVPQALPNDISNESSMGVIETTPGVVRNSQNFSLSTITEVEWKVFDDWWRTIDRATNFFVVPFEDDTDMGEFFCKILDYNITNREKDVYAFTFLALEAK